MDQNRLEKQKENKQQRLMMIIEQIERQMEDFQGQNEDNVIMLIGKTGCGKSTIYNFLCGAEFYINEDEQGRTTLELLSKSDIFQEIRGGLDSTTKTPKIYYNQEYQHFIIDYPGFNDTESKDQLAIQLFFNKIVTNRKIKIVYILLNPGDQFHNKAEDLQYFINKADIDLSQLTVIINSYSKKRTDDKLIADFQSQLMNKFQKYAHQLIVQREVDETEKIEKYLSNEQRKKMWMQLINSKVIQIKPYDLYIQEEVNNFILNASQELSDGLLQIFKDLQYKRYSTSKIQEIQQNIKILDNFSLILQRFLEGDVFVLYQVMVLVPNLNETYMKAVSRIYIFFLEYKTQLDGYLKMENSLFYANSNLKACLEYLYLKYQFLEQLKQVEEKNDLLEQEKQQMKIDKSKMEDRIRIKVDELNSLRELLTQTQDDIQNQIKQIKDQHLQEITNIINDKIKIEQQMRQLQDQYPEMQCKFAQLQNDNTQLAMELLQVKNVYNQVLIDSQIQEQTIQSQSDQAINQIQNLKQELLEQQLQNQKILEYNQDLQIQNKQITSEFNQLQAKYTIAEEQRNQLLEECKKYTDEIKKKHDELMKLKNENITIELDSNKGLLQSNQKNLNGLNIQNNFSDVSNRFGQVSQQNQAELIPSQQQCSKGENQLKLQQKSIKDDPNNLNPVVVLIGITGSGRTTLFNKICKSQEQVEVAKSTTRQSILGQSAYGHGFQVIDTPGLATLSNKIEHAVGIWNAVSYQPLNKIMLFLNFEKVQLMVNQLFKQIVILYRYRKLFIVAVTHFDKSQEKQHDQQKIQQEMKKYGIEQVVFFSKQDSGQEICNQIHKQLINSKPIQVELTEEEFLNNFDLLEDPEMGDDLLQFYQELFSISSMIMKMISQEVKGSVQLFQQSKEADTKYQKLQINIKLYTQLLIKEKVQIIQALMKMRLDRGIDIETFNISWFDHVEKLIQYQLKQDLFLEIKKLNQQVLFYLSNNPASIIHSLKVCKNCGLVWYCQTISNQKDYCKNPLQNENKTLFDSQFWEIVQLPIVKNISTADSQTHQQHILQCIKKNNSQKIIQGCGNQLDLISQDKNSVECFYLSLELFNQPIQYFFEQFLYSKLQNLVQSTKQKMPVKYLQI